MSKTNVHQKLRVLKPWLEDLKSNTKKQTQPEWLKKALADVRRGG